MFNGTMKTNVTHPGWLDLALCWLAAHVGGPAVVVWPRDSDAAATLLRSWGVDPVGIIGAEFAVVPFPSEEAAAAAARGVPQETAYVLVWNGNGLTTGNE